MPGICPSFGEFGGSGNQAATFPEFLQVPAFGFALVPASRFDADGELSAEWMKRRVGQGGVVAAAHLGGTRGIGGRALTLGKRGALIVLGALID